jgi:hypothetical protein
MIENVVKEGGYTVQMEAMDSQGPTLCVDTT